MNKRVKGAAVAPIVIGLACLAVGVVIGAGGMWYYMSTHQGGLGDAEDAGLPPEEAAVTEIVAPEMDVTEIPATEPVTENLSYIKVAVSGSDYIYKGEAFTLEQILAIVRTNPGLPVRIADDGASLRAYDALIAALNETGAVYAESNS